MNWTYDKPTRLGWYLQALIVPGSATDDELWVPSVLILEDDGWKHGDLTPLKRNALGPWFGPIPDPPETRA